MFPDKILSAFCAFFSLQLVGVIAYPMLNIPYLFGTETKYKKNELGFPVARLADEEIPMDGDVMELEHLKNSHADSIDSILESINSDNKKEKQHASIGETDVEKAGHTIVSPELQHGVDAETVVTLPPTTTAAAATTTTVKSTTVESRQVTGEIVGAGVHHPPTLSQNGGQQQTVVQETGISAEGSVGVPSGAKPFYGAARLAFGQNPEILPTSSTESTPTISTSSTSLSSSSTTSTSTSSAIIDSTLPSTTTTTPSTTTSTTEIPVTLGPTNTEATQIEMKTEISNPISTTTQVTTIPVMHKISTTSAPKHNEREIIGDLEITELEKVKRAVRRSIQHMTPKFTKNFLHLEDGQLSPFDMAQYIYLTGDEEGITQAIEECIDDGVLSREQALKLLHDIRVGIEYLQSSSQPRIFPEILHPNNIKKSFQTPSATTKKPLLTYAHLGKPLDSIALWNKLQELNSDGKQDLNDYDEAAGRAKIAEFLYTHYTVEEILYKLAKVMFTQSLAHGSDEAQRELQKLTDFLEREGTLGVIPVDLQKKILHVLLTALSDTLAEHPELLAAAEQSLVNPYDRIPMRTYGALN